MKTDPISTSILPADDAECRQRAGKWLVGLIVLTALLVIWGALVRLTGAGLSIPDWPLVNGSLLPPFSHNAWVSALHDYLVAASKLGDPAFPVAVSLPQFQTMFWIDYLHRTLSALSAILFLIIAIKILRSPPLRKELKINLVVTAVLLVAQILLGGVVTLTSLADLSVAFHLITGYLFIAALLWMALKLTRSAPTEGESRSAGLKPMLMIWAIEVLLGLQVVTGGLMAGNEQLVLISTWPEMFGSIFPSSAEFATHTVMIQFIHRWLPFLAFALFIVLGWMVKNTPFIPRARTAFTVAHALFGTQIVIGVLNVLTGAPTLISLLHSAMALALFGTFILLLHDLRYGVTVDDD